MISLMEDERIAGMLELARQMGLEAADTALPHAGRTAATRKVDNSLVTELDHTIQERIAARIVEHYPDHALLGEESSNGVVSPAAPQTSPCANVGQPEPEASACASLPETKPQASAKRIFALPDESAKHSYRSTSPLPSAARYCWVIDPIDGTRNFVNGVPCFSTSIAVLDRGQPVVGVVVEHNRRDVFEATLSGGARLNGDPIHCADPPPNRDTLIGLTSDKTSLTRKVLEAWSATQGIVLRNLGSTAVHLALVASGALAADFCCLCKIWDIAAGALLITEAGGRITTPYGDPRIPFDLSLEPTAKLPILAAAPATHERLLRTIRNATA
jgi:myo-inositol-1(or 4)-monophosphatase